MKQSHLYEDTARICSEMGMESVPKDVASFCCRASKEVLSLISAQDLASEIAEYTGFQSQ
jgi:hypothetical protein